LIAEISATSFIAKPARSAVLLEIEPAATSGGPIPFFHGVIHTIAVAVSKNL
jgi:hypothetical protein